MEQKCSCCFDSFLSEESLLRHQADCHIILIKQEPADIVVTVQQTTGKPAVLIKEEPGDVFKQTDESAVFIKRGSTDCVTVEQVGKSAIFIKEESTVDVVEQTGEIPQGEPCEKQGQRKVEQDLKERILDCKDSPNSLLEDNKYGVNEGCDQVLPGSEDGFGQSKNLNRNPNSVEKPYSCDVCDRRFRQRKDKLAHMRVHSGEKPYSCGVCDKKFARSSNQKSHMLVHTGEKPYSCKVCEKKFTQSAYLPVHMKTHTGEKSHACDFCDKKFLTSSSAAVHRRTHTGEKPYSCNVCLKNFAHSLSLKIHLNTHWRESGASDSLT